jgi:uncharacterized protein (DUF697 family)
VRIVAGALACTILGALIGAGVGFVLNLQPVPVPDEGLGFVNYVGPILGGSIGASLGLIFGGGWVARLVSKREETRRSL